jgi:hypothetical protein
MLERRVRANLFVCGDAMTRLNAATIGERFQKAYADAVRARDALENARQVLKKHEDTHG